MTSLLIFLVTAYVAVVIILFAAQRHLLYHTAGSLPPPETVGVPMRAVALNTADGLTLTAWYAPPRTAEGLVVVVFHGNSGTIAHRVDKARRFMAAGHGVLLVEYRGFGGNPGSPTEDGLYEDARAALRWLAGQGVAEQRLVLNGESLGTGIAVHLASETNPAALLLESPYTSIPEVAGKQYPFVPVKWLVLDRFDSLAKIGRVRAPVLIIHGERDGLIPVNHAGRLFAAAAEPKRVLVLPNAGHADLAAWGAGEAMVEFLSVLPSPARP